MKYSADGAYVEVVLSCHDVAYAEHNANDESERERSCFIGVASGQVLQIHFRHGGNWPETMTDLVVDGDLRRFVRQHNQFNEETMAKYVDQVWVESEKGIGYGSLIVKDSNPSSKSSLKDEVDPTTALATSSRRGSLVIMVYDPTAYHNGHRPAFPPFNLASPSSADCDDATFSHHIQIEPLVNARQTRMPRTMLDLGRPGQQPWATFTFHYRDEKLLKHMHMKSGVTSSWATPTGMTDCASAKRERMLQQDVRRGFGAYTTSSNSIPLGTNRQFAGSEAVEDDNAFWARREGDGYGPGSLYARQRSSSSQEAQSGQSVPVMPTTEEKSRTQTERKRPRLSLSESRFESDESLVRRPHITASTETKRVRFSISETSPFEDEIRYRIQEPTTTTITTNDDSADRKLFGRVRPGPNVDALGYKFAKTFKSTSSSTSMLEIPETPTSPTPKPVTISPPPVLPPPQHTPLDPRRRSSTLNTNLPTPISQANPTAEAFINMPPSCYTARLTLITLPDKITTNDEYVDNANLMPVERLRAVQDRAKQGFLADWHERQETIRREQEEWVRKRAERKRREGAGVGG